MHVHALVLVGVVIVGSSAFTKMSRGLEVRLKATMGGCLKSSLQWLEEDDMLKCLGLGRAGFWEREKPPAQFFLLLLFIQFALP